MSMTFFIAGSIVCGLSHSMILLLIGRGIQGLGAGGLMPLAMTISSDLFPVEQRAKITSWVTGRNDSRCEIVDELWPIWHYNMIEPDRDASFVRQKVNYVLKQICAALRKRGNSCFSDVRDLFSNLHQAAAHFHLYRRKIRRSDSPIPCFQHRSAVPAILQHANDCSRGPGAPGSGEMLVCWAKWRT